MATSNMCGIGSLPKETVGAEITIALRNAKRNKENFKLELIKLRNKFSEDSSEDFVNVIFEWMNVPFYSDKLKLMNMWLSKEDLTALFNSNNKSESEEVQSKEELISEEPHRYFEDISDRFIESVYGTSTAKDIMIKTFQKNLIKSLFVNLDDEIEVFTNDECNQYILDYQNQLFAQLKKAFPRELVEINSLFDEYGNSNLPLINSKLEGKKRNYTIAKLQAMSSNPLMKKTFDGYNALFILNNFDRFLCHQLPKLIKINHHEGVLYGNNTQYGNKYIFNFKNAFINNTWRNDDKEIDATEEVSHVIRRILESMNRATETGEPIVDSYLTFQEIASVNTVLRALAHHEYANDMFEIDGKSYTMRSLITYADSKNALGMKQLFEVLTHKDFTPAKYGLFKKHMQTIHAMYNGIFAERNSLYSIMSNNVDKIKSCDEEKTTYYDQVVNILAGQEAINMQEYSRKQGIVENTTLKGQQAVVQTYAIDNTIGGIFNVKTYEQRSNKSESEYIHFEANVTPYNDEAAKAIANKEKFEPVLRLTLTTTANDVVIERKKGGSITINSKNIKDYTVEELNKLFRECRNFFREVTRFTYDDRFIDILASRESGYAALLFKMATGIIYNYEVSKLLYKIEDKSVYDKAISGYFDPAENVRLYQHIKQLNYINDEFTAIKIALAQARDEYNDVVRTNTLKDAAGKQISAIGLDQIATKPEQQWDRSRRNENSPVRALSLLDLYRDQEFGRDFKGTDNKSATSFTEAENFIATFMFDYLSRIYPNKADNKTAGIIKILPSVISDKSRIPKTLFDLNAIVPGRQKENGESITYRELDTSDWQDIISEDLGNYYKSIYDNFEYNMGLANDAIQTILSNAEHPITKQLHKLNIFSLEFDYDTNFKFFNSSISKIDEKSRAIFVKQLLHEINKINKNTDYELIQNLHYSLNNKTGKLSGNAALYDLLYRWGKITISHKAYEAYGLNTGYGTATEFFRSKQYQYIEDLLKDNCEILLHDSYGNLFKDQAYEHLRQNGWTNTDNVIFAKINYKYLDENGNVVNKTLNITSKDDLKASFIYKQIKKAAAYNPDKYKADLLDINKQSFSLEAFVEAVNIYNMSQPSIQFRSDIKAQIKEKLADKNLSKDIINTLTDIFVDGITNNVSELKIDKNILGEISDRNLPMLVSKLLNNLYKSNKSKYQTLLSKNNDNVLKLESLFEINPDLAKFQAIDFALGLEYMNATLGTHLNHPGGGANLKQIEATSWNAQVKRNVSMTASKYRFALDQVNGIKSEYTIAVIEDDRDIVYNIFGRVDTAKPYDGATICSITSNYHENNSLGSNRAGIDKKQFIHDYKANSGSGIIVKTAGFPITNARLRNSKMLLSLNKRMLNITLSEPVRITTDYNGNLLLGTSLDGTNVNKYGDMTYVETINGKDYIFRTVGVTYLDNSSNMAKVFRQVYNPETNKWTHLNDEAEGVLVNLDSNYAIWKSIFGGENSITLYEDGTYEYNEKSCQQLAYAMNYVGTKKPGVDKVIAQSQVNQPLKQNVIDYIVTEGAIKQGAANVNSKEAYFNDDFELATMKLGMYDAGIQLNAEHHADNSTLSLMTQVLNALSARGYSMTEGDEVYSALRELTKEALKGFDLGTIGIKQGDTTEMLNFVADIILRSIKTVGSSDGNLIAALSSEIKKEYAAGNKVTYDLIRDNMPISMPGIFNKMVSLLASVLTQRCIRIKFPGSMDVLVPSNKIYKLYADHLLSYHKGNVDNLPNVSLIDEKGILQVGKIRMGRTYEISGKNYERQQVLIDDPRDYWLLRDLVNRGIINNIDEVQSVGRDLSTYGIQFTDNSGIIYNMWDIDSIKHLYLLEKQYRSLIEDINENGGITLEIAQSLEKIAKEVGYENDVYDVREFKNYLMQKLQNTLNNLSKGGEISVNGKLMQIYNIDIQPYELIASKVYETTFGLKQGDDVQEISNNKLFFVKRTLENLAKRATGNNYDVELTVLNGKHVYLLNNKSEIPKGLSEVTVEYQYEGDEIVQRDLSGKVVRKVSSMNDRIFIDSKGNEIIVTDNINFYVDNTNFVKIGLSGECDVDVLKDTLEQLTFSDNRAVKAMLSNLFYDDEMSYEELQKLDLSELSKIIDQRKEELLKIISERAIKEQEAIDSLKLQLNNPNIDVEALLTNTRDRTVKHIIIKGLEIHTSFLQSLEFLAARIPAQSHQSFMAMKLVGFDEAGKNSAYVSRMLIWLQGSDYDIDKVSLLGYKFKNGHFVKWSPYMNLMSKTLLEESKKLPFPTARESKVLVDVAEHCDKAKELYTIFSNTDENSIEHINAINNLIRYINKLGHVPFIDSQTSYAIKVIVDKHNLFFAKGGTKDGLINFISTSMYSVSKDPINLIQGQSPIDDMTDLIKDLAKKLPMHQKAFGFAPGSPQSKLSMLLLTLKGKENTGIVASAMKNFEACSQYYYKILFNGTPEQQARLKMDVSILGKEIRMLANAYAADTSNLDPTVIEALETVDNDTDAFLLFSAFLSLSTDNAKDPVLAKINAGPNMMSLYTAGLMMGFDVSTLINVMASDIGWEISNLMNSNVFNDTQGIFNIDGVFDYIEDGPFRLYLALSKKMKTAISKAVYYYYKKSRNNFNQDGKIKIEAVPDYLIKAAFKNPRFNLKKCLQDSYAEKGTEEKMEDLLQKAINDYKKTLTDRIEKLEKTKTSISEQITDLLNKGKLRTKAEDRQLKKLEKQLIKIENLYSETVSRSNILEEMIKNKDFGKDTEYDSEIKKEINKYVLELITVSAELQQIDIDDIYDFGEHDNVKMRRLYKAIRKYRSFMGVANTSMVTSPYDGQKYKAIDIIKQLSHIANEQSRLRPVLGLNQQLPNDIASQFKFLRNFESIFKQRADELSPNNKAVVRLKEIFGEDLKISFKEFMENPEYREHIIKEYESIKAAVNIFDVINTSSHYFGYAEALNANIQAMTMASTSYRVANQISEEVLNNYFKVARNGALHEKYIKRVQKFVANRINNQFLLSLDIIIKLDESVGRYTEEGKFIPNVGSEIILGTPDGNATFKYWMENFVIPTLQGRSAVSKFIKDLTKFSISNTMDGEGQVNYALTENMMPKSEYERALFKRYKDALNALQNETYNGYPLLDLFFYYNIIAYNNESTQNSFTTLFEDIFAEKTNDTVRRYVEFYSVFDKEGSFELGKDFTEDDLLKFIAPVETVETGKLKYIRVYNNTNMRMELLKLRENEQNEQDNETQDNDIVPEPQNEVPEGLDIENGNDEYSPYSEQVAFSDRIEGSRYEIIKSDTRPRYFANTYYSVPDRIALSGNISINTKNGLITISKQDFTPEQLLSLAKANGHGSLNMDKIIIRKLIRSPYGGTESIIDKKLTLSRIEQILEEYC